MVLGRVNEDKYVIYILMLLTGVDFDKQKRTPDVKNNALPEKEVLSDTFYKEDLHSEPKYLSNSLFERIFFFVIIKKYLYLCAFKSDGYKIFKLFV